MRLPTIVALLVLAAPAAASAAPKVTLTQPESSRTGAPVHLSGTVSGRVPARTRAVVETSFAEVGGTSYVRLATARIAHGRLTAHWTPPRGGIFPVRVRLIHSGRTLATSEPVTLGVVSVMPCVAAPAPDPASLPPGTGAIVGGVYNSGGPAPGVYNCVGDTGALTINDADGNGFTSVDVGPGGSFVAVLPAGDWYFDTGGCTGGATVLAGKLTHADAVCNVP